MRAVLGFLSLVLASLALFFGLVAAGDQAPEWRTLADGVSYTVIALAESPLGDGKLHVVRIDPDLASLRAEMARVATKRRGFWMLMTDSRKFGVIKDYAERYCTRAETSYTPDRWHMLVRCERGK